VFIADTNEVLRFRYDPQTSKRLCDAEHILDLPGMGYLQHWTRSLAFSPDCKKLFVSVGSSTKISIEQGSRPAAILVADPDGTNMRIYASGLRNAVGIAVSPPSGAQWATVNERDDVGDDLPPDYFTHVIDGGFYGWPYADVGGNADDRASPRPDLVRKMIAPDLLLDAHAAPLQFSFYEKQEFPPAYWQGAFVVEHGSWKRRVRTGHQVVFVLFRNGSPVSFFSGLYPTRKVRVFLGEWWASPLRRTVLC
jgi:glucose/arabinose dehydrogenase